MASLPSILFSVYYGVGDVCASRAYLVDKIFSFGKSSKFSTSLASVFFADCCVVVKPRRFARDASTTGFVVFEWIGELFSHFPGKSFSMAIFFHREFDNRMIDFSAQRMSERRFEKLKPDLGFKATFANKERRGKNNVSNVTNQKPSRSSNAALS